MLGVLQTSRLNRGAVRESATQRMLSKYRKSVPHAGILKQQTSGMKAPATLVVGRLPSFNSQGSNHVWRRANAGYFREPSPFFRWLLMLNTNVSLTDMEIAMTALDSHLRAERLESLTQAVGFALWQLQILEGSTAQYYVLVELAEPMMGEDNGNVLVEKAQRNTFGASISQLGRAKRLPDPILARFKVLLRERNWLVHGSRSGSQIALADATAFVELHSRLELITEEAGSLLKQIAALSEKFVVGKGISVELIATKTAEILAQWEIPADSTDPT